MSQLILVINLGSTTSKVALFRDLSCENVKTYSHDKQLMRMPLIDQKELRFNAIVDFLQESKVAPDDITIVSARGGLLHPIEGGSYLVNEDMIADLTSAKYGDHASNLSGIIAYEFANRFNIEAVITDPVVVDELCDEAKYTGLKNVKRTSIFHALNQKAVARKYATSINKSYDQLNLIVIHMGGGITVGAHKKGRVIDVNNGLNGDGPMSPTRAGAIPVNSLFKYMAQHSLTPEDIIPQISKNGGLLSHIGTEDVRAIVDGISAGNLENEKVLNAMAFQIGKEVGARAAVLHGQVDQIIFTGGVSYSQYVLDLIEPYISFIAPISVYAGELEMEALAYGAYSVSQNRQLLKEYRAEESHG